MREPGQLYAGTAAGHGSGARFMNAFYVSAQTLPATDLRALSLLDVFLVIVTAPVAVLLGAPALGTLVGAVAWVLQRFATLALERRAKKLDSVRAALGLNLGGAFARAWLVGLAILAVGLAGSREDGLAAAILVLVAFTIYLATTLLMRAVARGGDPS